MNKTLSVLMAVAIAFLSVSKSDAQNQVRKKTITRVFWQDATTKQLKYADLSTTDKWHIKTGSVSGMPLPMNQGDYLSEMVQTGKEIFLANISAKSSQALRINSGVTEVPHGNHFHWTYSGVPSVGPSQPLAGQVQGVALTDYLVWFSHAGGITKMSLSNNRLPSTYKVGGENPSLAVSNHYGVCYATRNGGGVVDLIRMKDASATEFQVPDGNLVAASANSGRAFFASPNKIHWILADGNASPKVLPVGNTNGLNIAGPLVNEKNWVLFTSNSETRKELCMINAATSNPVVLKLPIEVADGLKLSSPKTKLSLGKRFAFLFQQRSEESSRAKEQLTIVELDPNRDQNFDDAVVRANIPVGASKVSDNRGSHDICFDDYGRFAVFTEPSTGMLTIMTLNDLKIRARFKVGGTPDRIAAVGSPEHFH